MRADRGRYYYGMATWAEELEAVQKQQVPCLSPKFAQTFSGEHLAH